jgi:hypothetical protein
VTNEIETLATPVKTGKKRFNVKDVCAFYGVGHEKAEKLPWSDRYELINRHYDKQTLARKEAQIQRLKDHIATLEAEMAVLNPSKERFEKLLEAIK